MVFCLRESFDRFQMDICRSFEHVAGTSMYMTTKRWMTMNSKLGRLRKAVTVVWKQWEEIIESLSFLVSIRTNCFSDKIHSCYYLRSLINQIAEWEVRKGV
jgi:hypothetical protein